MQNFGILIPALDPDEKLITLLRQLLASQQAITSIVVVDDGSDAAHQAIFTQVQQLPDNRLHLLRHARNQGKGAALKTGFRYYLHQAKTAPVAGIATMDADGQHTVSALEQCLRLATGRPHDLIIGARQFTGNVPWRSRFGNILTDNLVRVLTHQTISDTQTGLRVIPLDYVRLAVDFPGDRFEFEFDMLLEAKKHHVTISEQPIPTIYLDGNASSHFRVIRDSLAIYARFFKFAASGLVSFIIDIGLFSVLMLLLDQNQSLRAIMVATVLARAVSSIVNYLVNRHVVFDNAGEQTLLKYVALLIVQTLASGYLTHGLTLALGMIWQSALTPTLAKLAGDFCLFLVSYYIQKNLIFKRRSHVE
ncbi:bifunctional glycosyltransferase family 2/GtrA family protein [Levilactobacillus acidifarinae]|uniref:Glycosyltransferase n=1 Tax=Levilactobacillus acidifarinae DSM 19394 = JCM 15949 TaxID=1423715 RepID=A0A0R1LM86_9LACO|nr:bifunctional glycosyltransferase family 2/GtrA family protein [Levilactobacillus acidifarinae]KRK94164.1 glycosyltransferase [Levilactobacillus acidifarinae DSM 19394]GEO70159.1 sugar translocase [Levilactobacillus acidifarinae]